VGANGVVVGVIVGVIVVVVVFRMQAIPHHEPES